LVVFSNAAIAPSRILNLLRSLDCVFIFEAIISPLTTEQQLQGWKTPINGFVESKPENWKKFNFNITCLDGVESKMVITMAAELR